VIGIATGIAILVGQTWGYLLGIGIAFVSTITNFAFVPYYPVWSLVVVAFDIFVIWALCSLIGSSRVDLAAYDDPPASPARDKAATPAPTTPSAPASDGVPTTR